MKRLLNTICCIVCFMLYAVSSHSQTTNDTLAHQLAIHLLGKYDGQKAILRWAPNKASAWEYSNYYGYTLERSMIKKGDNIIEQSTFEVVGDSILKPLPLESWEPLVNQYPDDDYIKIAAQTLYGTRPEEEKGDEDGFLKRSTEFQNLFTMNLLSAEFSAVAAQASALRIEDSSLDSDAVYVYRIFSRTPATTMPIDTGYVIVRTDTIMQLPKIYAAKSYEGEGFIEIGWEKEKFKHFYTGYHVERSDDNGSTFERITEIPVQRTAYKDSSLYVFSDSIPDLYRPFQYRVYGISPFAETGPPSDPIILQSKDRTPPTAPYNISTEYLGEGRMRVSWESDPADTDIDGFLVSRSNNIDNGFIQLTEEPLPANQYSFIDEGANELLDNYYFVGVVDTAGNGNVGFPKHGTIIDSLPPKPPVGLSGFIDTTGVVTVTWSPGMEPDLKGYFIHFANQEDHVFINKVGHPLVDTVWKDTIPLNVLTEEIYYKIVAVDHRYNYSGFSEVLTLIKPDKVAPDAPIFHDYNIEKDQITLQWHNPTAKDLEDVRLWKKEKKELEFQLIKTYTRSNLSNTYIDTDVKQGKYYDYALTAVDDANLESEMVGILSLQAYENMRLPDVSNVNIKLDGSTRQIDLSWDWVFGDEVKFVIYRSVGDHPYQTYKVLTGEKRAINDVNTFQKQAVKYRIKVVGAKGKTSGYSEEVVVKATD